jgi:hypothetical protein
MLPTASLLVLLLLTTASSLPTLVVPNHPDLTIKTRLIANNIGSSVQTLYLRAAHERTEWIAEKPTNSAPSSYTVIRRCDDKVGYSVNDSAKTYFQFPIEDWSERMKRTPGTAHPQQAGADVYVTIDAVDTGETRSFGSYTARHVRTTTKVEPSQGASTRPSVEQVDGWYIDLPGYGCEQRGGDAAGWLTTAVYAPGGAVREDRFHFTRNGTASRGYALEETRTKTEDGKSFSTKIELVQLSENPLNPELFQLPSGYRPALHNLWGGYDMTKPDTFGNRLEQYWIEAKMTMQRLFR